MKSLSTWLISFAVLFAIGCDSDNDGDGNLIPPGEPAFLQLTISPNLVDFSELTGDQATVQAIAVVQDSSHRNLAGIKVRFAAQRGQIDTVAVSDQIGRAIVNWWFTEDEIFPDTLSPELSIEATAEVNILWDAALLAVRR